jgi:tripartite-type tricarboxylate transporter receptor subunit TctC
VGPTPAEFYKGKTINIIVGRDVGSDEDTLSRLIASDLKEFTGAGAVIIENRGEAGGIEGLNLAYRGTPDGLTVHSDNLADIALLNMFEDPAAKFKMDEFTYIWGVPRKPLLFTISTKFATLDTLRANKDLKFAAGSPGGNFHVVNLIVAELLGLDAKIWGGVRGSDRLLRIAQGDMDGSVFHLRRASPGFEQGYLKPVIIIGPERLPEFPAVPTLRELYIPDDPLLQQAVGLCDNFLIFTYTLLAPPGVPQDRVKFLEEMWNKAVYANKDKLLEIYPLEHEPLSGAELQALAEEFGGEIRGELKTWLDELFLKYKA